MRYTAAVTAIAALGFTLAAAPFLHRTVSLAAASPLTSGGGIPNLQDPKPSPDAPDFPAGLEWLNTDRPLSLKELRGKVVVLDFWTFGCINCMHIIPDLKRLEEKYKDALVVIGVHSAKFANEKGSDNIRNAIQRYDLEHPVVNDKDFRVWQTYGAEAWPTVFLIAPDGKVAGYMSGEGIYEPFDKAIGELVKKFDADGKINRKPLHFVLEKDRKPKSVLSYPGKIAADAKSGRIFFADTGHNRLVITSLSGTIQQVIGEGSAGLKDGDLATAQFFHPQGLRYDATRDALFVADLDNHAIRKVDLKAGKVTTLAGNGQQARDYPPVGGVGKEVALSSPWDILLDPKNPNTLYIAMAGTHQLWSLDLKSLKAEPYAGTARENILDGPLTSANLAQPSGLTTDGERLYFADSESSAVRIAGLGGKGNVDTIIGQGLFQFGDVDGKYPGARLQHPLGVSWHEGYLYAADTYNHKIKRIDPKTKQSTTFLGTGKPGLTDGTAKTATLDEPGGLSWSGGKLYIADTNNHLIRVYDPATKMLSTLRLSGLEKLTHKSMPQFNGKEQRVTEQAISTNARSLEITVNLPAGTKFNLEAPFTLKAVSDKPEAVTVGDVSVTKPEKTLSIPITAKSGQATITVEMGLNYCSIGNAGLCYFKNIRAVIPIRVAEGGAASATLTLTP